MKYAKFLSKLIKIVNREIGSCEIVEAEDSKLNCTELISEDIVLYSSAETNELRIHFGLMVPPNESASISILIAKLATKARTTIYIDELMVITEDGRILLDEDAFAYEPSENS